MAQFTGIGELWRGFRSFGEYDGFTLYWVSK